MAEEQHAAVTLTDANFAAEVEEFSGIALVDFWAAWCGPCQIMGPRVEELATEYASNDQVKIGKLNADEQRETQGKYRILSLPTFKIFKDGKAIGQIVGAVPKEALKEAIEKALQLEANAA